MVKYLLCLTVFFSILSCQEEIKICPLDVGELMPPIPLMLRKPSNFGLLRIKACPDEEVFSISDGEVKRIGNRSKSLVIQSEELIYEYRYLISNLNEGDKVLKGTNIGKLAFDFFSLRINKGEKRVNAQDYVNCDFKSTYNQIY